jgi:hypothetical protein
VRRNSTCGKQPLTRQTYSLRTAPSVENSSATSLEAAVVVVQTMTPDVSRSRRLLAAKDIRMSVAE